MKNEEINSGIGFKLIDETTTRNSSLVNSALNIITRIIIVLLLTTGSVFTFTTMMGVKYVELPIYLLCGLLSVICVLLYRFLKKHWLVMLILFILAAGAGLIMIKPVITGGTLIYDSCISSIYKAMYWSAPNALIKWNDSYLFNTTYCIAILTVVVCNLVSYFTVARTQFIGVFLSTFPLFEIGAAFGCAPEHYAFAFMLAGWAGALVLHISNRQKVLIKHKNGSTQTKTKKYTYSDKNNFGGSALVMSIAILLVFSIVAGLLASNGFSRNEQTDALRKNAKETVLNAYDLVTGYDHDASLKDGRLYKLADRKVKNRHYATVTLPNTNQDMYLSGYVGSVYTGYSWEQLDDTSYKSISDVLAYFKEQGYSLPTITGDMLLTSDAKGLETAEIKVSDLRREKDYMYSAYGVEADATFTADYDKANTPKSSSEYSYTSYYNLKDMMQIPYTELYKSNSFKKYWKNYTSFVQQNYTLLPSGIDDIARLAQQFQGNSIYQLVDSVREFLQNNTTYSDAVQKLPDNKELASFFIYDEQQGYSAHYATAAAVMLRALGVPTRYVEGFYVSKDQIKKGTVNADGTNTVELTDENSHAWIEIYDSSYGWIPVEVTNGYYSGTLSNFIKEAKANAKNENKNKDTEKVDKNENNDNQQEEEASPEVSQDQGEQQQPETDTNENNNSNSNSNYKALLWWLLPSILLALLVIAIIVLIARRSIVIKKREEIFNSDKYKEQVLLSFWLLKKMLKFNKVKLSGTYSYDDFKNVVNDNCDEDSKKYLNSVFIIYEKSMFAKAYITEAEAQIVLDFIDDFGYNIYKQLTFMKMLKFKFINNLM